MAPGTTIRTLTVTAGMAWFTDAILAAFYRADSIRSISQGIAVTASVAAIMLSARPERPERTAPIEVKRYVSPSARLADLDPTTVEIRRRRPVAVPATVGARSQEYWEGFADVAETLLEKRADDPGPDVY